MRITFILPIVDMSGGIRVVAIYASALEKRGHEVQLISLPPKRTSFFNKSKKFLRSGVWPFDIHAHPSYLDESTLKHRILPQWRPITDDDVPDSDVVVATWWETAEWVNALRPNKGAKVYFIQGHEIFPHLPLDRCHATYRMPMHKIVIARWLKDVMQKQYQDDVVDIVSNSIDQTQFFASVRGKQSVPTIGFVYSTSVLKGLGVVLTVIKSLLKEIPNLRVISFGSEHPKDNFPLPEGALFTFSPPQGAIKDLYSQCDVWIAASRGDGFYLPAMEAMACRTPVVSTRIGWPEEAIISGENGVLVDIDDEAGLLSGAKWVLSLPGSEWQKLSFNAYTTATASTWEQSAERFEQALIHACRRAEKGEIGGKPMSNNLPL